MPDGLEFRLLEAGVSRRPSGPGGFPLLLSGS